MNKDVKKLKRDGSRVVKRVVFLFLMLVPIWKAFLRKNYSLSLFLPCAHLSDVLTCTCTVDVEVFLAPPGGKS